VRDLIDESRAWPRYELIDGELIVTPSASYPHQIAVGEILLAIKEYVLAEKVGLAVCSPADLELQPDTITQPDVFVLPAAAFPETDDTPSWADFTDLLLAVEIISPSSVRTDRIVKRDFYLRAGVAEYWIVDLDARIVERWMPDRETPEILRGIFEWKPAGADSPLIIDLVELFNTIWTQHRKLHQR
jgi:Uma2 family endonuclease